MTSKPPRPSLASLASLVARATLAALALLPLLASGARAQTTTGRNEKVFYNPRAILTSLRVSPTGADTLYFMQPGDFRTGHGRATGFRALLQDQNDRTSETVELAFVRYAAGGVKPATGAGSVVASARFTVFGKGTGKTSSQLLTFTLPAAVSLPSKVGLRLVLGAANGWPLDGVSVHYQSGLATKLPASVVKPQWTWSLSATGPVALGPAASTLHLGALYEEPVVQLVNRSSAYGSGAEDLPGPEALFPAGSRGDQVAAFVRADAWPKGVAVLFIAGAFAQTPVASPLGPLLLTPAAGFASLALPLDANGNARTASFALPQRVDIAVQAVVLDSALARLRTSDAARFRGQ